MTIFNIVIFKRREFDIERNNKKAEKMNLSLHPSILISYFSVHDPTQDSVCVCVCVCVCVRVCVQVYWGAALKWASSLSPRKKVRETAMGREREEEKRVGRERERKKQCVYRERMRERKRERERERERELKHWII